MKGTGAWLKVNGEAIYSTRPAKALSGLKAKPSALPAPKTAASSTQSSPVARLQLTLKSIRPRDGSRVTLLGSNAPLQWSFDSATGTTFSLPENLQQPATALRPRLDPENRARRKLVLVSIQVAPVSTSSRCPTLAISLDRKRRSTAHSRAPAHTDCLLAARQSPRQLATISASRSHKTLHRFPSIAQHSSVHAGNTLHRLIPSQKTLLKLAARIERRHRAFACPSQLPPMHVTPATFASCFICAICGLPSPSSVIHEPAG